MQKCQVQRAKVVLRPKCKLWFRFRPRNCP